MTHSANMLERAKDEPEQYNKWYAAALRANELAEVWLAECERLSPQIGEIKMGKVWWKIIFEAREAGAIGIFMPVEKIVAADDEATAINWAFDDLHDEDLETRGIVSVFGPVTRNEIKGD